MLRQVDNPYGHGIMFFYAVLTAFSATFIHEVNQQINPITSAFYTFMCCIAAYSCMAIPNRHFFSEIKRQWRPLLIMNMTTAICWLFTFMSLQTLPPYLYLFIYLCAMPISAAFIYRRQMIRAMLLLIGLIMLIPVAETRLLMPGIALAFAGGTSGTVYSIYSRQLANCFSSLQILSLRFYLTVLIAGLYCFTRQEAMSMPVNYYLAFVSLAIVSVVIPLYLFQAGLARLSLNATLAWLPLAPVLCYFMSAATGQIPWSPIQTAAVLLLCLAMVPTSSRKR